MLVRILTALVLAPIIVLLTLKLPTQWFSLMLLAIVILGLSEWNMLTLRSRAGFAVVAIIIAVLTWWWVSMPSLLGAISVAGAILWCFHVIDLIKNGLIEPYKPRTGFMVGAFCLFATWAGLVYLHQLSPGGPYLCISLLLIVWAADSFAYFSGKKLGRHKLAPKISPNKTLEGVAGGVLGAVIVAVLVAVFLPEEVAGRTWIWVVAGVLAALVSIPGDLYQSRLKRNSGVKDSGSILPGHGGVLDRIDGVIAAVPVFVSIWYLTA